MSAAITATIGRQAVAHPYFVGQCPAAVEWHLNQVLGSIQDCPMGRGSIAGMNSNSHYMFILHDGQCGYFVGAGRGLYGVMVSWLYALYSFDYRWSLSNKRLPERIAFFQQHWAFFLGALCTAPCLKAVANC